MRHRSSVVLDDKTVYPRARKACTAAAFTAAGLTSSGSVQVTVPNECVPVMSEAPCEPVVVLHPGSIIKLAINNAAQPTADRFGTEREKFVSTMFGFTGSSSMRDVSTGIDFCRQSRPG